MPAIDLSTTLGNIPLTSVIYNASGPRTGSSAAMSKIASSEFIILLCFVVGSLMVHLTIIYHIPPSVYVFIHQGESGAVLAKSATADSQKGNDMPR